MKNKKVLAVVIAALSLTLAACNGANNSSSNSQKTPDTPIQSTPVSGLTLDKSTYECSIDEEFTLKATVTPENATVKDVTWFSSNTFVASVVNGKVKTHDYGEAVITAMTLDGKKQATCKVTVMDYINVVCMVDDASGAYPYCDGTDAKFINKTTDGYNFEYRITTDILYFDAVYDDKNYTSQAVIIYGQKSTSTRKTALGYAGIANGKYFYPISDLNYDSYYAQMIVEANEAHKYPYVLNTNSTQTAIMPVDTSLLTEGSNYAAVPGSYVTFAIQMLPGYDFNGEVSITSGGNAVNFINNGDGTVTFVMPQTDVNISIGTTALLNPIEIFDDYEIVKNIYVDGVESDMKAAPTGSRVRIELYNSPQSTLLGTYGKLLTAETVYFGDMENVGEYPVTDRAFEFTMPGYVVLFQPAITARSVTFTVDTGNPFLVTDVYGVDAEGYLEYLTTIRNGDNGAIKTFLGDVIYFNTYALNDLPVYATNMYLAPYTYRSNNIEYENEVRATKSSNTSLSTYQGLFYYEFAEIYLSELKFVVSSNDARLYSESTIFGEYYGYELYGSRAGKVTSPTEIYIYLSGQIAQNGTSLIGNITDFTSVDNTGFLTNSNGSKYPFYYTQGYYGQNVFIRSYYSGDNIFTGDDYIYMEIPYGLDPADFTIQYESIAGGDYMSFAMYYLEDIFFSSVFIDTVNEKVYVDAEFYMIQGESITDENAIYEVYDGLTYDYITTVGLVGNTTGRANRTVDDGSRLSGYYALSDYDSLYIDGLNHVYYGDWWTIVSIDENNLVTCQLNGSKDKIVFTVVPELHAAYGFEYIPYVPSNVLDGRTFTGTIKRYSSNTSSSGTNCNLTIEFVDATHFVMTCNVASSGSNSYLGNVKTQSKLDKCTYVVDGNKVTLEFYINEYATTLTTWELTLSDDMTTLSASFAARPVGAAGTSSYSSKYYFDKAFTVTCPTLNGYEAPVA